VRLKRYLEMRGADVGPPERICALAALMVGLYYDRQALAAAGDLVRGWSAAERESLRDEAPRLGLAARAAGRDLRAIAGEALAIARAGLMRRARSDATGRDETIYLAPLEKIVADGRVPAERWIARFEGAWGRRVDPAFEEATI
jgi:glutamate--cysteine ligase